MANVSIQISARELRTQQVFKSLMWGLSYPGRAYKLPAANSSQIINVAETLLDLETSFFTPETDMAKAIAHFGAQKLSPDCAMYHFYPQLTQAELDFVSQAQVGTLLYPDQAATLVIGCEIGQGTRMNWSGPGINGTQSVSIGALPAEFWNLRDMKMQFPLGWDVFLIDNNQVIALPRTSQVEVIEWPM